MPRPEGRTGPHRRREADLEDLGEPTQEHPATRHPGQDRPGLRRGPGQQAVAARLGVCTATVGTWRRRFVERRLEGLADEPRPGAPRKVTDADVERVVTRTLETKPKAATHWSTRGMAEAAGMSQSAVGRIWRPSA